MSCYPKVRDEQPARVHLELDRQVDHPLHELPFSVASSRSMASSFFRTNLDEPNCLLCPTTGGSIPRIDIRRGSNPRRQHRMCPGSVEED